MAASLNDRQKEVGSFTISEWSELQIPTQNGLEVVFLRQHGAEKEMGNCKRPVDLCTKLNRDLRLVEQGKSGKQLSRSTTICI